MSLSYESAVPKPPPTGTIGQLVAALRARPAPPPGFVNASRTVLEINFAVIALCWIGSWQLRGNSHYLFGEKKPGTLASVAVLVCSGIICFQVRKILLAPGGPTESAPQELAAASQGAVVATPPTTPLAKFFLAFGILLCFTGLDDLLEFHERADKLIHRILGMDPNNRITDHLDDMIVLAYILPALYLGFRHRARLFEAALAVQMLTLAAAVFLVHLAYDVFSWSRPMEESLKLTAGSLILIAFLAIRYDAALLQSWRQRR